ncbi:MAG TPA: serine/threonine-protein kinase [Solirubrobacteraceae bacterium]|jgi:serine/threonine protein kinase|nr:serine/threonine-protein kinase [Solirubrobacteraceae bacterium]
MVQAQRRVGRYDVLEVIGRGGAAVVYLAYQRDLRRRVALKELLAQHLADPSFAERFVEESRLAGAMSHSSIVTVHEFFEHDGVPYIAMEYLPRGSLRPYVGRLSVAQVAGVLESVLAGLSCGERQGVVHRDLKPENLLVAADGRVKIADFGVARAYNAAAPRAVVTATGTTIGTPAYMAPEQALGEELTAATDLYSLGIVAWEMFTGTVPFESTGTPVAVLYRQVHEPVPPVREIDPEIDERLASWLDKTLAKRPGDRFPTADSAWEALEDIVIELLGPRWRREARLGADPPEPGRHPLTPAEFERGSAEPARPAAAPPAPVTPTEAPVVAASSANTTILRPGRRHRIPDTPTRPQPERPSRRRTAIAALLAVTAVAAAIGVVVGAGTGGGASHGRTTATGTQALAAAVDRQVSGVLRSLATARTAGLSRERSAGTAAQQAVAAATIASDYRTAASQVAAVPGSPASLHTTLVDLTASYRALAAAARARSISSYRRISARIVAEETQLRAQAASF